jgi:DNA polymerase elongation subunit (family B)
MSNQTEKTLESLYEGEFSAAETYKQAIKKVGTDPKADQLLKMQKEHVQALGSLKKIVPAFSDRNFEGSGAWGTWAKTVMGTAQIFGDKAALKALKEGEEHGLKGYKDALEKDISLDAKTLIRNELIPNQQKHIKTINSLMENL